MKKFILLYRGPATPPKASHTGWLGWFSKLGVGLVDKGYPTNNSVVLHSDGSATDSKPTVNGYSIIQATNIDEALALVKSHPFLALGSEYSIEIIGTQ